MAPFVSTVIKNPDIIYTTLWKMQQIYYIHNGSNSVMYIINMLQTAQRCVYNILYTQRCVVCNRFIIYTTCANATNILYTQRRQMATLDAPKLLVLTNQTKLTLNVTLILTDTVTVIFFTRISSTLIKRLYRNKKRNFCRGTVVGFVGGPFSVV